MIEYTFLNRQHITLQDNILCSIIIFYFTDILQIARVSMGDKAAGDQPHFWGLSPVSFCAHWSMYIDNLHIFTVDKCKLLLTIIFNVNNLSSCFNSHIHQNFKSKQEIPGLCTSIKKVHQSKSRNRDLSPFTGCSTGLRTYW